MKSAFAWFAGMFMILTLATTVMAEESAFDLQGEGRAADMTSIEKNVSLIRILSSKLRAIPGIECHRRENFLSTGKKGKG